ncbi:MAG: DUF1360 domain-containing protein [Polyangiaceae bacterium]|nr:DUF1360 domain-containing protein [Polyangiaceae bacterium]
MEEHSLEHGGTSPFSAYELLSGIFNVALLRLASTNRAKERFRGPIQWGDIALIGTATHKLTLILTRDRVTMPLRAPFTLQRDEGPGGHREEQPERRGLRRALGELLTCQYCTAPWVATGLVAGHVVAPEATRVVTSVFSAVALSDVLNRAYGILRAKGEQASHHA